MQERILHLCYGQKEAVTVWRRFLRIEGWRMVRLKGGRGTEPVNPWWQEIRLRNCIPVYRNHTQACAGIGPSGD